jgi:hypothetical protein
MNRRLLSGVIALGAAAAWTTAFPGAQTKKKADWLTDGADAQRTAWQRNDDYVPEEQIYGQAFIGVKQNPQTKALELKDWYSPSNAVWMRKRDLDFDASSPIFDYRGTAAAPSPRPFAAGWQQARVTSTFPALTARCMRSGSRSRSNVRRVILASRQ